MTTLLQDMLLLTIEKQQDSILSKYIQTVVPALEREFGPVSGLGGSAEIHFEKIKAVESEKDQSWNPNKAWNKARGYAQKADQTLAAHVLNALLIGWKLMPYLDLDDPFTEVEQRLFCLGITLHDYDKHCHAQCLRKPDSDQTKEVKALCLRLGEKLNFTAFWSDWQNYISEISYLAQNAHNKKDTNLAPDNWTPFFVDQDTEERLTGEIRTLVTLSDVAVHVANPGAVRRKALKQHTETKGDRLYEGIRLLCPDYELSYHYLRDSFGILSNMIHNTLLQEMKRHSWEPLMFFAQGVVYLKPKGSKLPEAFEPKDLIWNSIKQKLLIKMKGGDVGFKRGGKGLKFSPQTLELLEVKELILILPNVVQNKVKNIKNPAAPNRIKKVQERLEITDSELAELTKYIDFRSDQFAEFIGLLQKELFKESISEFAEWVLGYLDLDSKISFEQTQVNAGGVNYGWYYVAAVYLVKHSEIDDIQFTEFLNHFAEDLSVWAEQNNLLNEQENITKVVFWNYLNSALEIDLKTSGLPSFTTELNNYTESKLRRTGQPICSLSSGEFTAEDQVETVVLFKPQQYSNKNTLGGRQIKRGISKPWSLEMLLRQAFWNAKPGGFDDLNPVFLSIFPAYVYAPKVIVAITQLLNTGAFARANLWKIRQHWLESDLQVESLRSYDWFATQRKEGKAAQSQYSRSDLSLMATHFTKAKDATVTESWIEPAFLSLLFPYLLGVKVVASRSMIPLYQSDQDFRETVILDGPAGFWSLMGLPTSLRVEEVEGALKLLLTMYCLHLGVQKKSKAKKTKVKSSDSSAPAQEGQPKDPRWQDFTKTVQEVMTNVLNVFFLADQMIRAEKGRNPYAREVKEFCGYAQFLKNQLSKTKPNMEKNISIVHELVLQCREFYRVNIEDSSHKMRLPITRAFESVVDTSENWNNVLLIDTGSGQIHEAIKRQSNQKKEIFRRPIIADTSNPVFREREAEELEAIKRFMRLFVEKVFQDLCNGDRAILNEQQNLIKSGFEFIYRQKIYEDIAERKAAKVESKTEE